MLLCARHCVNSFVDKHINFKVTLFHQLTAEQKSKKTVKSLGQWVTDILLHYSVCLFVLWLRLLAVQIFYWSPIMVWITAYFMNVRSALFLFWNFFFFFPPPSDSISIFFFLSKTVKVCGWLVYMFVCGENEFLEIRLCET